MKSAAAVSQRWRWRRRRSYQGNADLVALDEALASLSQLDARQSRVVELRFFGGLTVEETAEVLKVSAATVRRDWSVARAWLRREMVGSKEQRANG